MSTTACRFGRGSIALVLSGLLLLCCAVSAHADPRLELTATDVMLDELPTVRAVGLEPGSPAAIESLITDLLGRKWTGRGEFVADDAGIIDVSRSASVTGTYTGVDAAGLFWSMLPVAAEEIPAFRERMRQDPKQAPFPILDPVQPHIVSLTLWIDGRAASTTQLTRRVIAQDVVITPVREGRLRGKLFMPAKPRAAAMILLAGSGGGIDAPKAALLASRGYVAFALGYMGYEDIPPVSVNVDLELFREAAAWLERKLGHDRIGIMGQSRGAEAALLSASYFPCSFKAVIAVMPTHVVNNGVGARMETDVPFWRLEGRALPFVRPRYPDISSLGKSARAPARYRPYFLTAWNAEGREEKYAIPVERIRAPVLLISGEFDDTWPSAIAGDRIVQRLRRKAFEYPLEHLRLAGAGHGLFRPNLPMRLASVYYHPVIGQFVSNGGDEESNARASRESWQGTLRFLERVFSSRD